MKRTRRLKIGNPIAPIPKYTMEMRRNFWKELSTIVGFTVPLDGLISMLSEQISIDIIRFDKMIGNNVREYKPDECLYKGENKSMKEVIEIVYGKRAAELTEILLS